MYVVTGASYGIGRAVAINLATRGLPVLAVARSSQTLNYLAEAFHQIQPIAADISTKKGLGAVVSATSSCVAVSGLVHCAGSRVNPEPFHLIDTEALIEHFRVHVAAQIVLTQMLSQNSSVERVVFIDSYSASEPRDGWGAYSIIKASAQMVARCAAQEIHQTRTVRVFPGAVQTGVVDAIIRSGAKASQAFAAMAASGQVAPPEEVAEFIAAILVDTADELIDSMCVWDYNNEKHRLLAQGA
jgi:benzil reductase ((S)-benzoin forming)